MSGNSQYSGDLKSDHLKSGNIWNLKSRVFEGLNSNDLVFKWSGFSYGYSHSKTGPFKIWMFLSRFQMVFDKMAPICLDFKCPFRAHSKSRPFATQPLYDHSKSKLVQISDPLFTLKVTWVNHGKLLTACRSIFNFL